MALDSNDLPDEMDLASSEYLQSFTFRLRGREKVFLDKIEKAQAEPAAKLAKLTEAVDKLRAAPASAAVAAAPAATSTVPKDVTGSVTPPQTVAAAARRHAERSASTGLFVLVAKKEGKIDVPGFYTQLTLPTDDSV